MEDVIMILVLIGITALGIIIGYKSFLDCPVEVFLKIIRLLYFC